MTTSQARTTVVELSKPDELPFPNEYFHNATADHFWVRARTARFLAMARQQAVDAQAPCRLLEVGCGNGVVRAQVEATYPNWTVDGCDLDRPGLEMNPANLRGATYFYDIHHREPTLHQAYHGALLFDVLEHIEDPVAFLHSVAWHLKPGAWLALNVPALPSLYSQYDAVQGHVKRYTARVLRQELADGGFTPQRVAYWGFGLAPLLYIRKPLVNRKTDTQAILRAGFRPPGKLANAVLGGVLALERAVLPQPPAGTSLMAWARLKG